MIAALLKPHIEASEPTVVSSMLAASGE